MTPVTLRAYIASKCEESGASFKTAEAIRSAFKRYFRDEFGSQGDLWRKENGIWLRNPVFETHLEDYVMSLRKRHGTEAQLNQSLPMHYKDLEKLQRFLESQEAPTKFGKGWVTVMQAFVTTGFTLWTR